MWHGPASIAVTGIARADSSNIWVIPSFRPKMPFVTTAMSPRCARQLDLDLYPGWELETREVLDRSRRRIDDVDQTAVRPHLEVLARVLVLVRRCDDSEDVVLRRQRNGAR